MTSPHATRPPHPLPAARRQARSPARSQVRTRRSLLESLENRLCRTATTATIDFSATKQTVEGLGAAPIVYSQPSEFGTASFYDKLVNDLGVSGSRAPIEPDFEPENDNNDPNVFDWSKVNSAALAPSMNFLKNLQERGTKQFFMTVWTPPYWMKTNHSVLGGGSLRADMRAEFAEFVAAVVIAAKRDYGIQLAGISVQNEQFFVENYESSVMDDAMLRETTIAVQKKLAYEHLTTKVLANEDLGFPTPSRWQWFNKPLLQDDEIDKSQLIIGAHATSPSAMPQLAAQLAGSGVPLWFTEVSGKGPDWVSGLQTDGELSDIFTKANATSYYYWFYDEPASTGGDGTATLMIDNVPNAKYFALKHFYKYVRPGMQRVATKIDETGGTRLSAFKDPKTGESTIVLVNMSQTPTDYTLNLSNLGHAASYDGYESSTNNYWQSLGKVTGNGSLSLSLPGYSVVTLHDGPEQEVVTGGTPAAIVNAPTAPDITSAFGASDYKSLFAAQMRSAAYNGDLNAVKNLGWIGDWVEVGDPHGWTALDAVAASSYEPPNPNLGFATAKANADLLGVMDELLHPTTAGTTPANPNSRTDEGFTPLMIAAMNNFGEYGAPDAMKADLISKLVAAGADVNAVDNQGRTALHWAALSMGATGEGSYNALALQRLMSLGADKTIKDAAGKTAYDYSMQEYKGYFATLLSGPGLDTTAPRARLAKFMQDKNEVSLVLTEDVSATLAASDLVLTDRTTGATLNGFTMAAPAFASGLTYAHVKFSALLPDGKYRLTIPAGAFADQSGVLSTQPITVDFTVLRGDTDGNGTVDFSDLLMLAKNFGTSASTTVSGTSVTKSWSTGDFNGDGVVNFDDLLLLAKNYGKTL